MASPVRGGQFNLLISDPQKIESAELVKIREFLKSFDIYQPTSGKNEKQLKDSRLALDLVCNLVSELTLPFISDVTVASLDDIQQQLVQFRFFKSIFLTASQASLRGELDQKDQITIRCFIGSFSNCSLKEMISESDHPHLSALFTEIVECQRLIHTMQEQIGEDRDASKGALLRITKDGKIRGWLLGTMHDLERPSMVKAAKLSGTIYRKLQQCAILGTEIKLREGALGDSVEDRLIDFARRNGVFNLGLDTPDRDEALDRSQYEKGRILYCGLNENTVIPEDADEKEAAQLKELIDIKKQNNAQLDQFAKGYHEGNLGTMRAACESIVNKNPTSNTVELKRQACLIHNIDACLRSLENVKREPGEELPKGFFGVGTAHVLCGVVGEKSTVPDLIEGLRQRGWELEQETSKV